MLVFPRDFGGCGGAHVLHHPSSMRSRLRSVVLTLAGLLVPGCGASSADNSFGGGDAVTAEVPDDVGYPETKEPDTDAGASDVAPPPSDCPPGTESKVNVCIRVSQGAKGPKLDASLGLDGVGALVVGLSKTPPTKSLTGYSWVSKEIFPSVSSGTAFRMPDDLPKTAEFLVDPGSYYVWAVFRDQEPYERAPAVGDYVPIDVVQIEITKDDLAKPKGIGKELKIYPVRGVDVDVSIKTGVKPLGNGIGPLRVRLLGSAGGDGAVLGESRVACVDLVTLKSTSVKLLTTTSIDSSPTTFLVRAGLFDFSNGADDPTLDAALAPAGSLINLGDDKATFDAGAWTAPRVSLLLDHAIPFTGAPGSDPSTICGYTSSAPSK